MDVLVIGCGPVGAFLCALLRGYGVSLLCVERDAGVYPAPRAVAMDDGVIRLMGLAHPRLAAWLAAHVLPAPLDVRTAPPPPPAAWSSFSVLGPFPPRAVAASGGHPDLSFFHQPSLEAQLRAAAFGGGGGARLEAGAAAGALRAAPCAGCAAAAAAAAAGGGEDGAPLLRSQRPGCGACRVRAWVAPPGVAAGGAGGRWVSARWVVGADGGSSGVRRALGVPFTGASFPDEPWLVVDVESEDPALCARWRCFNFVCDPSRPFVHCPLPGSGRRFEFILNPGETPGEMVAPARVEALLAGIGVPLAAVRVLRTVVYTFHARSAEAWRVGRCVLAGDAAHCMPPFRGQGMCSGLRDAANLAWKLAACVAAEKGGTGSGGGGGGGGEGSGGEGEGSEGEGSGSEGEGGGAAGGGAQTPFLEALLDSYHCERAAHVAAVTRLTLALGALIMLRSPPLAWARNALFAAANALPPTRALLRDPIALPSRSAPPGAFLCAADGTGASGEALPNLPVTAAGCGSGGGGAVAWDAALWALREGERGGARAPGVPPWAPWALLLAPGDDACGSGSGSGSGGAHWGSLLRGAAAVAAAAARGGGGSGSGAQPALPPVLVVQLLPATGAGARLEAHAAWRRSPSPAPPPGEAWWPVAHGAVGDVTSGLQAWLAARGAAGALIRPDGVVFAAYGRGWEERARVAYGLRVAAGAAGAGRGVEWAPLRAGAAGAPLRRLCAAAAAACGAAAAWAARGGRWEAAAAATALAAAALLLMMVLQLTLAGAGRPSAAAGGGLSRAVKRAQCAPRPKKEKAL